MDGTKQAQTSFQQEFNRLTFLASIASVSTSPSPSPSPSPDDNKELKTIVTSPHTDMRNVKAVQKGNNGIHMTIKRSTTTSPVNKMNSRNETSKINNAGNMNNNFFANSPIAAAASASNSPINTNIVSVQQHPHSPSFQRHLENSIVTQASMLNNNNQAQPPVFNNKSLVSNSYMSPNSPSMNNIGQPVSNNIAVHANLQAALQNNKLQSGTFINQGSPPIITTTVGSTNHQLNAPIVVSQMQQIAANSTKVLSQSTVSNSMGQQTILLPANFAGEGIVGLFFTSCI